MVRAVPPPLSPNRVVTYIRVSALMGRVQGGRDFYSPEVQMDGIRSLISRENLREVAVVDDDIDASGQTMARKGIARIRALVESRQVDILAVHTLSRIGRNLAEALTFIRWLRERGVRVISASEGFDETPEGQFQLGLWLNLAELQGQQIGASWARIIERRARIGRAHGRNAVGYLKNPDGDLIVDPDLGPAVTEMFTAYARGASIASITATFAAARQLPISRRTVKHMLGNALYHGRVVVQSKLGGTMDHPGIHPPLVDDDTWKLVQARMYEDARTPARHLSPAFALTGLLECAHCGRALLVRTGTEKGVRVRRIFCGHGNMTHGCKGIGRPLCGPIEAALLDEVVNFARYLRDERPATRKPEAWRLRRDAATVERELAGTRDAMARVTERWARKAMPDSTYETTMARLSAAEQEQLTELRAVETPIATPAPATTLALAERLLALWPKMLPPERNFALKAVLRKAVIRRAEFWREPAADRIVSVELRWPHGYMP